MLSLSLSLSLSDSSLINQPQSNDHHSSVHHPNNLYQIFGVTNRKIKDPITSIPLPIAVPLSNSEVSSAAQPPTLLPSIDDFIIQESTESIDHFSVRSCSILGCKIDRMLTP
ncbi:hypothetical protein PTKIN_Ptkin01aG0258800 [Pterospermum kingtungense]